MLIGVNIVFFRPFSVLTNEPNCEFMKISASDYNRIIEVGLIITRQLHVVTLTLCSIIHDGSFVKVFFNCFLGLLYLKLNIIIKIFNVTVNQCFSNWVYSQS